MNISRHASTSKETSSLSGKSFNNILITCTKQYNTIFSMQNFEQNEINGAEEWSKLDTACTLKQKKSSGLLKLNISRDISLSSVAKLYTTFKNTIVQFKSYFFSQLRAYWNCIYVSISIYLKKLWIQTKEMCKDAID